MGRSPMNGAAAPQSPFVTVEGALPSGKDPMPGSTKKDTPRCDAPRSVALGGTALLGSCTSAAPASAEPPRASHHENDYGGAVTNLNR